MKKIVALILGVILFTSCSNNYSNGERIGTVNKLSKKGLIWDSWEGHLNITQTGMTSTDGFDFSIDNDDEPEGLVTMLDSAANNGWKVKVKYHQVAGFNWLSNRGETDYFVTEIEILDRDFGDPLGIKRNKPVNDSNTVVGGRVVDTIYVVIVDKNRLK